MGGTNDAWMAAAQQRYSPRKVEKWVAMAGAACTVFGREGYARASVDALAAEAGVSTRTLYNHFPGGKADLFRTVVTWTSGEVKDAQLFCLQAVLDPARPPRPEDLERDLGVLARGFVGLMEDYPNHFALVRHIHAEADHVPPEVLDAWREAGPGPVGHALAEALEGLAAAGLLDLHGDAALAATHFMALISNTITQQSHYGVLPLPKEETERLIAGGVAAFVRAYRAG
ncbi:TetR/AcrR family transcriptional regulator [Streptomyces sp. NBC_01275]|uniref:TetR/AcrR family transcriptional regulator n=1 Tax=Streptomyces sp. NBC_01275 TaxID=2903807 RepID=UPI0022596D50|nr:TetR/AcrR family transcriptional regulator [Streptomyces sp. NBC_01275]MCX4765776.1 TetR/AcrR family transcriptional regulator [Streptomyces sp. NBC_01275]